MTTASLNCGFTGFSLTKWSWIFIGGGRGRICKETIDSRAWSGNSAIYGLVCAKEMCALSNVSSSNTPCLSPPPRDTGKVFGQRSCVEIIIISGRGLGAVCTREWLQPSVQQHDGTLFVYLPSPPLFPPLPSSFRIPLQRCKTKCWNFFIFFVTGKFFRIVFSLGGGGGWNGIGGEVTRARFSSFVSVTCDVEVKECGDGAPRGRNWK